MTTSIILIIIIIIFMKMMGASIHLFNAMEVQRRILSIGCTLLQPPLNSHIIIIIIIIIIITLILINIIIITIVSFPHLVDSGVRRLASASLPARSG